MTKNIGMNVAEPQKACKDRKCPFHGELHVRGRRFVGTVVSDKMANTVTVQWERRYSLPKFERFERRRTKLKAHNPPCLDVGIGDKVRIAETRPISKTKHFVVIEKLQE